jgi:hypothetical protein
MRDVTVTNISHYRRPYKVIVQQITPSSLLQRMTESAAFFAPSSREPLAVSATVTPIDRFQSRRIR